jgi:hypothetical protein
MKLPIVLKIAALVVHAGLSAIPPQPTHDRVSYERVGGVRVGMTFDQLKSVYSVSMTVEDEIVEGGCTFAYPKRNPHGISFMVISGIVARIDLFHPGFKTQAGGQVGDSEKTIKSLYGGRLKTTPHTYVENGHYLTVRSSNGKSSLVFETDGKVVTGIRIGRLPEAEYIEGCL